MNIYHKYSAVWVHIIAKIILAFPFLNDFILFLIIIGFSFDFIFFIASDFYSFWNMHNLKHVLC